MVICREARADDAALEARARELALRDAAPLLHFEPVLRPSLDGLSLAARTDTKRDVLRLGPRAIAEIEGTAWTTDLDVPARGWDAAVRLSYDLGPVRITAHASVHGVDARFGGGAYREIGVSIGRTFRLSRWMTAWVSLDIGQRHWLGEGPPPAGEADSTQIMLNLGTTFR